MSTRRVFQHAAAGDESRLYGQYYIKKKSSLGIGSSSSRSFFGGHATCCLSPVVARPFGMPSRCSARFPTRRFQKNSRRLCQSLVPPQCAEYRARAASRVPSRQSTHPLGLQEARCARKSSFAGSIMPVHPSPRLATRAEYRAW